MQTKVVEMSSSLHVGPLLNSDKWKKKKTGRGVNTSHNIFNIKI